MKICKMRLMNNRSLCKVANKHQHIYHNARVHAHLQYGWGKLIAKLYEWLDANNICHTIRRLLVQVIDQWRSDNEVVGLFTFDFYGV